MDKQYEAMRAEIKRLHEVCREKNSALKNARMAIESLGTQLDKYTVPAWQYKSTLANLDNIIE